MTSSSLDTGRLLHKRPGEEERNSTLATVCKKIPIFPVLSTWSSSRILKILGTVEPRN